MSSLDVYYTKDPTQVVTYVLGPNLLSHEQAVRNAHAQQSGDYNTWDYDTKYPFDHRFRIGDGVIRYGLHYALVNRAVCQMLAVKYPRAIAMHTCKGVDYTEWFAWTWAVKPADAHRMLGWVRERGGLVVWESADLATAGDTVTAPWKDKAGSIKPAPHWSYTTFFAHTTDPGVPVVEDVEEAGRWSVAFKRECRGMLLRADSQRKVNLYMQRHKADPTNPPIYYTFEDREVVFHVIKATYPLDVWCQMHPASV
jgi:hypothetical protein